MKQTINPEIMERAARRRATIDLPTVAIDCDCHVDAMIPMVGEHQSFSAFATAPDVLQKVFGLPVTHANQPGPNFL